jgi:serine/threonine protein kinase
LSAAVLSSLPLLSFFSQIDMRVPRSLKDVQAAKRVEKRHPAIPNGDTIAKKLSTKKKRADKLRALAGAFVIDETVGGSLISPLTAKYDQHEQIGSGKAGIKVFRCTDRSTGQDFAVKRVPKALLGCTHGDERPFLRTVQDGIHLIKLHEVLEDMNTLYFVMELARGGDLFERVVGRGALAEEDAREVMRGLIAALSEIHAAGFVHRDVKLENILLLDEVIAADRVRLADFEFTCAIPAAGPVGSEMYAAPEVLKGEGYGAAVDVWALGLAAYAMLGAEAPPPVANEGLEALRFDSAVWENVSPIAKDLIRGMLQPLPEARLTLDTVAGHPWLCGAHTEATASRPRPVVKFSQRLSWSPKEMAWSGAGCTFKKTTPFILSSVGGQEEEDVEMTDADGARKRSNSL